MQVINHTAALIVAIATLWSVSRAGAQTLPAAPPAVLTPAGMIRFEAAGRPIICQPADRPWIESAVAAATPPPPTTRPADLLARIGQTRAALSDAMHADLPTLDAAQADHFFDADLVPLLKNLDQVSARPVYLIAPADTIKQALRAGWTDPRVHYNKAADRIEAEPGVAFDLPGRVPESAVLISFDPAIDAPKRSAQLAEFIRVTEREIDTLLAARATQFTVADVAEFLAKGPLASLPRGDDQIWLADGLSTVLAIDYVSQFHGATPLALVRRVAYEPPDSPIKAASIDLLRPVPSDQLRPELALPYAAARHRKNIAVMYLWMRRVAAAQGVPQATEDLKPARATVAALLKAIQQAKPADGQTLAAVVKSASGVDLSVELAPE